MDKTHKKAAEQGGKKLETPRGASYEEFMQAWSSESEAAVAPGAGAEAPRQQDHQTQNRPVDEDVNQEIVHSKPTLRVGGVIPENPKNENGVAPGYPKRTIHPKTPMQAIDKASRDGALPILSLRPANTHRTFGNPRPDRRTNDEHAFQPKATQAHNTNFEVGRDRSNEDGYRMQGRSNYSSASPTMASSSRGEHHRFTNVRTRVVETTPLTPIFSWPFEGQLNEVGKEMAKIRRPPPRSPEMWSNPGQETHHHPLLKGHPELLISLRSTPTPPAGRGEGSFQPPGRGRCQAHPPPSDLRGTPDTLRSTSTTLAGCSRGSMATPAREKNHRPPPSGPQETNPPHSTPIRPAVRGEESFPTPARGVYQASQPPSGPRAQRSLRSTPTTPAGQGEGSVSTPGRGIHHLSFPTGHRGTPNPARVTPTGRGQGRASSFDMRNPRAFPVLGGRLDRTTIYGTASFSSDPYMTNLFDTVAPLPMSPSLALQIRDELFRSEAQYSGLDTLSRAPHMTANSLVSEDNNPLGSSDARHPSTDSQSLPFTPTQLWTPKHLIGLSGGVTEFPSGPLMPPITNSVRAPGYSDYLIPEIPLTSRTGPGAWAIEGAGMAPSRPRYPPSSQYTPQEQRKSMTSAPPIPLLMM